MKSIFDYVKLCTSTVVIAVCCISVIAGQATASVKVVATGSEFHLLRPSDFRDNLTELQSLPFDGIQMTPDESHGSIYYNYATVMAPSNWLTSDLQASANILSAITSPMKNESFMLAWLDYAGIQRISWSDDTRWSTIANNFGVMAWLAKTGGLKGLMVDPEDYGSQQFTYDSTADGDWATCTNRVRTRGQQVMNAIQTQYPGITLLFFNLLSNEYYYLQWANPAGAVKSNNRLFPSFVNGMLDVLGSQVKLVDGDEYGYFCNFSKDYPLIRTTALNTLVDPANQPKYQNQVQIGFGQYLTSYLVDSSNVWYQGPLNGSRADSLRQNVWNALTTADGDKYVWVYGETQAHWAAMPRPYGSLTNSSPHWDDLIPGASEALRLAKSPRDEGRRLVDSGVLTNVTVNGDFNQRGPLSISFPMLSDWHTGNGAPAGWAWWRPIGNNGTFLWERGIGFSDLYSALTAGVGTGCLIQSYRVLPGDWYEVEGMAWPRQGSQPTLLVAWMNSSNQWVGQSDTISFSRTTRIPRRRYRWLSRQLYMWRTAYDTVIVPDGATQMVLELQPNQTTNGALCYFDTIGAYKLP